jgi:hypothetical protein
MNNKTKTFIPIEFDKQDIGHEFHGPLTWKLMTTYYGLINNKLYKKGSDIKEPINEQINKHSRKIKQYVTSIKNL